MPLLASFTSTLAVGTKTVTQLPTGERKPSFSYTGATAVACRFYDRAAASRQRAWGVTLDIDAVALVAYAQNIQPLLTNAVDGERMQVQITNRRRISARRAARSSAASGWADCCGGTTGKCRKAA